MEIEALPNRAEIIDDVRLGHISPNMAERWNSNMGWEPFPEFRDKASFDPMQASEWTLPMAAAWFIWRSADAVRDQWPIYRRAWLTNADPDNLRPELEVSLSKLFASADLSRLAIRGARSDERLTRKLRPGSHASDISPKTRFEAAVDNLNVTGVSNANLARKPLSRSVLKRHVEHLMHGENAARIPAIDTPSSGHGCRRPLEFTHLLVHRDEVINADEHASQAEFDEPRWTLEHVLGWIAHRNARRFRRLAPIDSSSSHRPSSRDWAMSYALDFAIDDPDAILRPAVLKEQINPEFESNSSEKQHRHPLPRDWWIDGKLTLVRGLHFSRDSVIGLWVPILPSRPTQPSKDAEATNSRKRRQYKTLADLPPMLGHVIDIMRDKWPQKNWPSSQGQRRREIEAEYVNARKLGPRPGPSLKTILRALVAFDRLSVPEPWKK